MPQQEPQEPLSFPIAPDSVPVQRRAVFSRSVFGVTSQHAIASGSRIEQSRPYRRKFADDSLRLIDDLTNRPVDPLFSDARLTQRPTSALTTWFTRVIVFLICIVVGFSGCLFVQQLQSDPRKEVRRSLAQELDQQHASLDDLTVSTGKLRSEVEKESQTLAHSSNDPTYLQDQMSLGLLPVKGEGITLTLANPIAANQDSAGGFPRESAGSHIRVVTDTDLQQFVSLLWQSGAEAISVNGYRISVQSSIRTAGQTILIGVNQVQSPYKIEAIGDKNVLANNVGAQAQPYLYAAFEDAGITPQVSKSNSIALDAASSTDVTYARRSN